MVNLTHPALDVGIVTHDLAGQTRFYADVLGLPVTGSVDIPNVGAITRLAVGESTLRLMVPVNPAQPAPQAGGFAGTQGIRYLVLKVSGLAETVDRIAEAGFAIAVPLHELRPGVRVALVEDSDGNTVELMEVSPS